VSKKKNENINNGYGFLINNNENEGLSEFKDYMNPFELPERMANNMQYLEMYPVSLTASSSYYENKDAKLNQESFVPMSEPNQFDRQFRSRFSFEWFRQWHVY